jgi:hypothetical protein
MISILNKSKNHSFSDLWATMSIKPLVNWWTIHNRSTCQQNPLTTFVMSKLRKLNHLIELRVGRVYYCLFFSTF